MEWNKVTEKLPEHRTTVLLYHEGCVYEARFYKTFTDYFFYFFDKENIFITPDKGMYEVEYYQKDLWGRMPHLND